MEVHLRHGCSTSGQSPPSFLGEAVVVDDAEIIEREHVGRCRGKIDLSMSNVSQVLLALVNRAMPPFTG